MNAAQIMALVTARGFRFSKTHGQNFLIDEEVLGEIVAASGATGQDYALEIGPGAGALTHVLASEVKKLIAVEIDVQLIDMLQTVMQGQANLRIVQGDVLKIDLAQLVQQEFGEAPFHVLSNLPYSQTTPIISMLLHSTLPIASMTLMMQKEAAQRLIALPSTPQYGPMAVFAYGDYEVSPCFDVEAQCFIPPPQVVSSVMYLRRRGESCLNYPDRKHFVRTVQAGFLMRRKMLSNNLVSAFALSRAQAIEVIERCGLRSDIRGEALTPEQFALLSTTLYEM